MIGNPRLCVVVGVEVEDCGVLVPHIHTPQGIYPDLAIGPRWVRIDSAVPPGRDGARTPYGDSQGPGSAD